MTEEKTTWLKKKDVKKKDVLKKKTLFSNTDFLIPSLSRLKNNTILLKQYMEITKDNKVEKKTLQVKKRRYFLTL